MKDVWIYAEHQRGKWTSVTQELLVVGKSMADSLGGKLNAIVFGAEVEDLAATLGIWQVDRVYLVQDPQVSYYNALIYTETMVHLVQEYGCPEMILFGATYLGRELAPAVAARLETGSAADCCDVQLDATGYLRQIVPGLGGSIFATIVTPNHRPQVATVKPGMLDVELIDTDQTPKQQPEIISVAPKIPGNSSAIQLQTVRDKPPVDAQLESAERVVAGGIGLGTLEGWEMLQELAEVLGAAVGATRPIVDEGWAKHEEMIGQSGITVRPELYIGVGISGDMMHTVGIKGKGTWVAINSDPQAPIFHQVDLGIAEDYQKILPVLIQELKDRT